MLFKKFTSVHFQTCTNIHPNSFVIWDICRIFCKPSIFIPDISPYNYIHCRIFKFLHISWYKIGFYIIITVNKRNKCSCCGLHSRITSCSQSHILRIPYNNNFIRIFFLKLCHDFHTGVLATVVHTDNFHIAIFLRNNTIQTASNIFFHIVDWNYNRNLFHKTQNLEIILYVLLMQFSVLIPLFCIEAEKFPMLTEMT